MSDDPEENTRTATELALSGTTAALSVSLSSDAGIGSVLAAAGVAIVPAVGSRLAGLAVRAYGRRIDGQLDQWLALLAAYLDIGDAQAAAQHIEESIDEPWAHSGVVEGVRAILQDVDDCVLPHLARLTAFYFRDRKAIDEFGKRATRLFVQCDLARLQEMRRLVAKAHAELGDQRNLVEARLQVSSTTQASECVLFELGGDSERRLRSWSVRPEAHRVFHLLKIHEFASDNPAGYWGAQSGPHIAILNRQDMSYLARLLV